MSLVNRRLVIFPPLMLTFQFSSSRASGVFCLRKMLKMEGKRGHCFSEPFSHAANHLDCSCSLIIYLLSDVS